MKQTDILSRNKMEPAGAWFPPAPERDAAPVVIVQAQASRVTEDGDAVKAENADLRKQVAALEAALAYHREKAAQPIREVDRTSWLRAALCGTATSSPLATVGTMQTSLYRAEKCGSLNVIRA